MSVNVGDLEGVLTRYELLLDQWCLCGPKLKNWNVDYGEEVALAEGLHEAVLELQGEGFTELVGR